MIRANITYIEAEKLLKQQKLTSTLEGLASLGYPYFELKISNHHLLIYLKKTSYLIYEIGKQIGYGDDGDVLEAIDLTNNMKVAIKKTFVWQNLPKIESLHNLVETINSSDINVRYIQDRYNTGARLAFEKIGKHPSMTEVFNFGVAIDCSMQQKKWHCGHVANTVMEYAYPLKQMESIYPDIENIFKIIIDFYDAQQEFFSKNIAFGDMSKGNFLFGNDTIKFTDFDNNIFEVSDPNIRMYCRIYVEFIPWHLLKPRKWNQTIISQFHRLRDDLQLIIANDTVCNDRSAFIPRMKNFTYHSAMYLCQDEGISKKACGNRFGFFINPGQRNYHNKMKLSFLGSIGMHLIRDVIKKLASDKGLSDAVIDHSINIALSMILLSTSEHAALAVSLLIGEGLSMTGLVSRTTSNMISVLVSLTSQVVNAFIKGDYYLPLNFAKEFIESLFGAVSGSLCYQGIKKLNHLVTDDNFANEARCVIC